MVKVFKVDSSFDYSVVVGTSCAFGVFDGVHRGHKFLLQQACETAHNKGGLSLALTFDRDPDEVYRPQSLKKLMTNERRIQALAESGVDAVIVFPFTEEFGAQSPQEFLASSFKGVSPSTLHVGLDFHFGSHASGSVADLRRWGDAVGMQVFAYDLALDAGAPITATRIRRLLADCKVEEAVALLGHPYTFTGRVVQGRGEGASMGFATANLALSREFQTLGEGVYAARVTIDDVRYKCAMSVGPAPSFEKAVAPVEAHILDFSGDLYGKDIEIEPVTLLRPMIKFETVEELIATVTSNIEWVRRNI